MKFFFGEPVYLVGSIMIPEAELKQCAEVDRPNAEAALQPEFRNEVRTL